MSPSDLELCLSQAGGPPTLVPSPALEQRLDFRCLHPAPAEPAAAAEALPLVIHLHLHYLETLPAILELLECSRPGLGRFSLLVTTTSSLKAVELDPVLRGSALVQAAERCELVVTRNIGRNIAPLLAEVWPRLEDAELLLHLHGKRSLDSQLYEGWLASLLTTLLPSAETVRQLLATFRAVPTLGLVMPQAPEALRPHLNWGGNFELARLLASWHPEGLSLSPLAPLLFPAGMMFWCRPRALQPLAVQVAQLASLPLEPIPVDGTSLHAIERLVAHSCEASGYDWALITPSPPPPGLAPARLRVWTPLEQEFLQCTALALHQASQRQAEQGRRNADLEQRMVLLQAELERQQQERARCQEALRRSEQLRLGAEQGEARLNATLTALTGSRSWRWTGWIRRLLGG